jgi:CHAT domain-containing protein/Flp pilus assembly protein TadD
MTTTLLLSLVMPGLLIGSTPIGIGLAQTPTNQSRQAEADRLDKEAKEQYNHSQFKEALETFQKVLVIRREIGDRSREGTTLNNIGVVYTILGQYPKALEFYQQALAIDKELGDCAGEGTTLNSIGGVYYRLGQYPKALEFYQQALAIRKEVGDRAGEGTTLNGIGGVYYSLGQHPKALEFYQQALAIDEELGDRAGEGTTLNGIGGVYYSLGQYTKALDFYQQALAIRKEVDDRAGEGTTLNNIGLVYRILGQNLKALEFYHQALAIKKEVGDRSGEGSTLNNIGVFYTSLGQYPKALEFYHQALAIKKEVGDDRSGESTTLNNIGVVYGHLGQYHKALEFFQQALAIDKELGDRSGEGTTLNNIGLAYKSLAQSTKALEFYHQALAIVKAVGDRSGEGATLNNIGFVYDNLGQYPKALEFYHQALAITKEIGNRPMEGATLNNIGFVYDNLGQYPKALEFYHQALAIRKEVGDRSGEGTTLNNIGGVYDNLEQYPDAEKNLFAAIEIWESLRTGLTDANKVSIFETQANTYRFLQSTLIAQNKITSALEVSERGRARAFVELLASKISNDSKNKILPPNIQQIQQTAKEHNSTIVQYSVFENQALYIWIIQPTGKVTFKRVDLKPLKTSLKDLVTSSRTTIGVRNRSLAAVKPRPGNAPSQSQRLQQLHQILIAPIAELLPKDPEQQVIFIPQDELFLVPFPALQDANGKYLIEQHTILTAPAIQVLQLTRNTKMARLKNGAIGNNGAETLVVGNPTMPTITIGAYSESLSNLDGAEKEAVEIAKLFNTQAIIGKQATKASIVQQMLNAKTIHLATHGLLDDFKGLGVPGAIALAPDGTGEANDGLLTSSEILDLKLQADLVVLSACDTGRGTITGDGVIGLSRSLITAGVPSVIVSLWSVPDAPTSVLMTEFYNQLKQSPNKAQALRQAMLKTMKDHPEPIDWAAFTLIGEAE